MVNYENGKIYKIESLKGNKVYIGSTTKKYLSQRMDTHRSDYKRWRNNKKGYVTSYNLFEEYGIENCEIVLLELFPCGSLDELHAREGYYIREIDCVNKIVQGRTRQEYNETNKDKFKKYRTDNKEMIKQRHTKWYKDNKELISEKTKQYRESNKSKIQEKTKISFLCECGSCIRVCHKLDHLKTKKHQKFVEQLQETN